MNKITIMGRLTRDPEMVTLSTGNEKCRFTVAVDRRTKKDQPKKADFFDCDAWAATAAFVNNWFKKGAGIVVCGRMESSTSEKDGNKRTFWTLNVEDVYFPIGTKIEKPADAPAVDPQSGMEKVDTEELQF